MSSFAGGFCPLAVVRVRIGVMEIRVEFRRGQGGSVLVYGYVVSPGGG